MAESLQLNNQDYISAALDRILPDKARRADMRLALEDVLFDDVSRCFSEDCSDQATIQALYDLVAGNYVQPNDLSGMYDAVHTLFRHNMSLVVHLVNDGFRRISDEEILDYFHKDAVTTKAALRRLMRGQKQDPSLARRREERAYDMTPYMGCTQEAKRPDRAEEGAASAATLPETPRGAAKRRSMSPSDSHEAVNTPLLQDYDQS